MAADLSKNISEVQTTRLLRDIVRCNTTNPPGNERECCDILHEYFRDAGVNSEILEYAPGRANVVAKVKGSGGGRSVMLNGHLDVVAPGTGWTKDPFGGTIEGGRMYGRGTSDMKSGVVAAAVALRAIVDSGMALGGDIMFTGVADEESSGPAGTKYLLSKGITSDMAIVTEPTDLQIETAQRGILWMEVKTFGRAAHGGRPWLGNNAIMQMNEFLNRLKGLQSHLSSRKHHLLSSPSLNVGTITGGTRINVVAAECTVTIDRRTIPTESADQALSEITSIIQELEAADKDFHATLRELGRSTAFETAGDHPLVRNLRSSFTTVTGREPIIAGKDASSDASLLTDAGIPTVLFGPGQHRVSHTADEYVDLEKVVQAAKILTLTVVRSTAGA